MSILKKLKSSGINMIVLMAAVLVFAGSFCALQGLASAQKPATVTILSATRNLPLGHVIVPADLAEKTVYKDENANLYIPSEATASVVGGIVGTPIYAGQPIVRPAIIADASKMYRMSAVLEDYVGYSIFPFPLDKMNVIAPELETFYPGDLIGITAVIASRPTHPDELTQQMQGYGDMFQQPETLAEDEAMTPEQEKQQGETEEMLKETYPPLAKDLFPSGVRVIAVQGLPEPAPVPSEDDVLSGGAQEQPAFDNFDQPEMLLLLIPNNAREILSLAMQKGDSLVVTLLAHGEEYPSSGFTYWDFESLFEADRSKALGIPLEETGTLPPADDAAAPYGSSISETSPTTSTETTTAAITETALSTDETGENPTTAFGPTDIFYLNVTLANAPDNTQVKAVWSIEDVEGVDPSIIDAFESSGGGDDTFPFHLGNNTPWPVGEYKVDIYVNNELTRTLEFSVGQ